MRDVFDHIIEPEKGVAYGVFDGWGHSRTLYFIKLPLWEKLYGQRSKYYKLAKDLSSRTCCTVICAENHGDELSGKYDLDVISQYAESATGEIRSLRVFGIGEGARLCLSWLCREKEVEKMLLVNMPISYELGETVELLNTVDKRKVKFVYGDGDPSYRFTPLLRRMYADVYIIEGADHSFTGMRFAFRDLQKLI